MKNHLLIIDDDPNLAMALSDALEFEGYETSFATDPLVGLNEIYDSLPNAVICDWRMPNLNGGELLRIIRTTEETKHIPFIIVTAGTVFESEVGSAVILTKPFSIYTLVDAIKQANCV